MENNLDSLFEANRSLWDSRVNDHVQSDFYNVNAFREGQSTLNKPELDALGDVKGKSLLHLQCHFGMDTLSWERLGATVTGIDFSPEAIAAAKKLAAECNLKGEFVCSSVYDLPENLNGQFDIVFTSYGTIGWLPDLDKWAAVIAHFLKPGGTFYIADFHPVLWMFDDQIENIRYHYFNRELIETDVTGSYAAKEAGTAKKEYGWNHSLSEIVTALLKQNLKITQLSEHNFSPYNCFAGLVQGEDKMWRVEKFEGKIPMMYEIKAVK